MDHLILFSKQQLYLWKQAMWSAFGLRLQAQSLINSDNFNSDFLDQSRKLIFGQAQLLYLFHTSHSINRNFFFVMSSIGIIKITSSSLIGLILFLSSWFHFNSISISILRFKPIWLLWISFSKFRNRLGTQCSSLQPEFFLAKTELGNTLHSRRLSHLHHQILSTSSSSSTFDSLMVGILDCFHTFSVEEGFLRSNMNRSTDLTLELLWPSKSSDQYRKVNQSVPG